MKKRIFMLLFAIGMLLALCAGANAADVNNENALRTAIDNGTSVKLMTDITLTAPLTVGKSMTLDLNGKTLKYTGSAGSIITVENATLIIADSAAESGQYGRITSDDVATSENGGGLYIGNGGTVEMQAGSIYNCVATENGGGVYVDAGGTLEMSAGSIHSCEVNKYSASGGGVYINAGGTFTMTGGQIVDCKASGSGEICGGGVYVTSMGNPAAYGDPSGGEKIEYGFRMSGGSIQKCTVRSDNNNACGGGVYVGHGGDSDGIFEMDSGSSILNCKAYSSYKAYGGGVYVDNIEGNGLFKMNGGTIKGCEATSISNYYNPAHGGGVCVKYGVFEMAGGEVDSSCISYKNGDAVDGGVCIGCDGSSGTMLAHGGAVHCTVLNHEGTITTDENPSGITTFYGTVINDQGTISGGTFEGAVDNGSDSTLSSTISGGTFNGTVINRKSGEISDGTFYGPVTNEADVGPGAYIGTISGGTFDKTPYGAYLVTFDTRGGVPVPASQVRVNAPASEPTIKLTKDNQYFLGWYTDSACTQPYNFENTYSERIMSDTTLYALWSGDRCTMMFDSDGGSEVEPQRTLISGYMAVEPADPTKDGATFLGWFTESGKHWNFTHDSVTGNITLKAMWSGGSITPPPSTVAVTGVTLDKTTLTLAKGESETLTATVEPENAANKTVIWSSTDASVAAVSDGKVTAGMAGMALIVARTADGNYIAACTVTVSADTPTHPARPAIAVAGTYTYNGSVQTAHVTGYDSAVMNITGSSGTNAGSYTVSVTSRTGQWTDGSAAAVTAAWRIEKAEQAAPAGLTGAAPSAPGGNDGRITGTSTAMEYRAAFERAYLPCPGTEITGLSAGTYFVRFREDPNHKPGADASVTVGAGTPHAEYTITFDGNGGMISLGSMTTSGRKLAFLPDASRSGYRFDGWYTEKSGGTQVTTDTVFNANTTVYAHWIYTGTGSSGTTGGRDSVPSTVQPPAGTFPDVPAGSYYEPAVNWAVRTGVTAGTGAARFCPDGICTRAQAVTFLWRAAGSPAPETRAMPFADVPAGSYYYDAVLWAVEAGITRGTSGSTFSPELHCSRAQIVAFLWRSEDAPAAGGGNPFTDVPSSAYYADAVLWAVKEQITNGTGSGTFSPNADCTRAQIVSFLWRCKA